MYTDILKKDLKRKKTMNLILLLFIILAVTFISSSVNNVISVSTALDSYFKKAEVPDYWICVSDMKEVEKIEDYIKGEGLELFSQELNQIEPERILINGKKIDYTSTIVLSDNKNTVKIFDEADAQIKEVKDGEIYATSELFSRCGLKEGERIQINKGGITKNFILKEKTKDAFFSSSMVGMTRLLISESDYRALSGEDDVKIQSIGIFTDDVEKFTDKFNARQFNTVFSNPKSVIKTMYIIDMVQAAVILIVSVCLILISLVILRFTINFTMSEEFREIGVMKAIGIPNHKIRGLYIVKYLAIAAVGGMIGLAASIPFGKLLISGVSRNIIVSGGGGYMINILCAVAVVGIILLFGYLCTGRIKKLTPIDAIRNGEKGERYKRKGILRLGRTKAAPVWFMAVNDILSGLRRFSVLIVIFTLGILLIIIPVNTNNTLQSDSLLSWFSMAPCDQVINKELLLNNENKNYEKIENNLNEIKEKLAQSDIKADVFMELLFRMNISYKDKVSTSLAFQGSGDVTAADYSYLKGSAPKKADEVGISHVIADRLGADIGDTVEINIGSEIRKYMVTAIFQTMNNMGEGIRFYQDEKLDYNYAAGSFGIQIRYTDGPDAKQLSERKEELKKIFPAYEVYTPGEYISHMIGDIGEQMQGLKQLILLVVICINILVTVLMVKSFITKEKGEIGMLKAVGFRDMQLVCWQTLRIGIVLFAAVLIGTVAATPLSKMTSGQIFKLMGAASIEFEVVPAEVYVLYPLIVFAATILAGFLTACQIHKISALETSNIE